MAHGRQLCPDDAILDGCRRGDPRAFDAFVQFYKDVLDIRAQGRGIPRADVPDVIQVTFVKAWRTFKRHGQRAFRHPPSKEGWILGWLTVTMYRCWYSECRRRKRHRSIAEDYASQPGDNNPRTTEDLPLLKRALAELPEAEQKITAMRFAQYSYAEIASEHQLASEDAAAKRVQRSLTKLQKLMSDKIKARAKGGLG